MLASFVVAADKCLLLTYDVAYALTDSLGGRGTEREKEVSVAVNGIPSHSYGVSLAIWDHTVLPATRHK